MRAFVTPVLIRTFWRTDWSAKPSRDQFVPCQVSAIGRCAAVDQVPAQRPVVAGEEAAAVGKIQAASTPASTRLVAKFLILMTTNLVETAGPDIGRTVSISRPRSLDLARPVFTAG